MTEQYQEFVNREAEVVALAPDTVEHARAYVEAHNIPFPCLADPDRQVYDRYQVKSTLLSLGQRPALFVIDKGGLVRFAQIGSQQWQIPTNQEVLAVLDALR